MNFINIKSPTLQNILRIEKESQRLRKTFAIHISVKELVSKMYKKIL